MAWRLAACVGVLIGAFAAFIQPANRAILICFLRLIMALYSRALFRRFIPPLYSSALSCP
jgi:hypothetical protein